MLKLSLAIAITECRKKTEFSQKDVAKYLGLTRASVVNMEKGRQSITAENLYKLACLYNVEVSKFFPPLKTVEVSWVEKKVKVPAKTKIVREKKFKTN